MERVYKILLIDDETSDINLIETELSKLDIQVQIDIIQKKEQLIDQLDNNTPDLVISDYHMPTLKGINALQIIQKRQPQLPFIMVAGSIGEEKAINVILQGASDYAMKQNLDRLGPAVLREHANYKEHNKKREQLEKNHSQYENLLQSVNGIVWEADAETLEFLYISPQSKQLLGYTPEEWLGEPNFWKEHIHPDDRKEAIDFCHHKVQQGENHEFEYRMIDARNEVVWMRDYVTVVTENGKPNRLCGFIVDISRERKVERQRDKAYEIADIGHWELDLINEELYWSNAVKKLHEVDPGYDPTLDTALDFYKEGEHRQIITAAVENAIETGESFEVELQIITSTGEEKWVRAVGETEFRNGMCMRIYGSTQDISTRKVSEKKYRDIFNLSPQPMWVYDPETLKFLDVNQAAMNHYGFSYEEFMSMTLKDIRPGNDIPDLMEAEKEIRPKKDDYYEGLFRHKTKDKSIIHVNIKRTTIDYEGRKASIVLAEDVTEKLETERELQVSEQKFKSLVQSGASMIAVLNEEGIFTYVSENYEQIAGWSSQELIGKNAFEFMHPDEKDQVQALFQKLQTDKENQQSLPYRFKHKKGHWIWKESIGSDLSDNTILNGYVINSHDITERRYYTALEKIERDILEESITGNSSLSVLAEKLLLKIEDLHPCMRCSIHEIVDGKLQSLASPNLPSDFMDIIEGLGVGPHAGSCGTAAYLKEPVIAENIYENPHWEGYRYLGDTYDFSACWSKPILDSNQNVVATFAIYYKIPQAPSDSEKNTIDRVIHLFRLLFDSFEKEKAEQKLALREQRFKSLVQDGSDLMAILDQEGNYTYVAPTSESVLGISPEEFMGNNALDYIHDKHKGRIEQVLATLPDKKRTTIKPFLFKDGNGGWRWVETIITNLLDNPAIQGFIANSRDVTVQIEREQKLKDNLELYKYVTKATDDVIYDWDITEDILSWDDSFHDKFIYNIEKGTYSIDDWAQNVHPEDREEAQQSLNDLLKSSESKWEHEYRFKKHDGTYATVFERGFIIRDQNGEAIRMIGSLLDITDRKKYEEELEQLSLVASKATDLIIMTDPEENITWVNQSFVELTGYSFEESMGQNPGELLQGPDTDSVTVNRLATAMQKRDSVQEIILNYSKTGQPYWLDLTIDPIFDDEGYCEGFIAIEKEVTEQVERQKALRESLERYETVSKATSDTIWELDLETDTIDYSQNIYNVFGYERQQVDEVENWWRSKIHPDDLSLVFENIEEALRSSTERFQMEYRFQIADGSYKYIYDRAFIVEDKEGNPIRIIGAMRDVTDQKEAEQSLQKLYQRNRLVLESTDEGIYGIDNQGYCTFINRAAANMLGYSSEECIGMNMHELIHHQKPNGEPYPESECPIYISKNKYESCRITDEVFWRADGTCFNVEYTSNPMIEEGKIKGGVVAFSDITVRKQQEIELQDSLEEKETLLMEIHHRVKNNLAVVSGMMQLQAYEENNEHIKQRLNVATNRIKTMGGIHELLYQSESFTRIDADKNMRKLVTDIVETFQNGAELDIKFDLQKISLNINQAIPFSLIVNEVITNVMKHAFIDRNHGILSVILTEKDDVTSIRIMDNGRGLPDNFNAISTSSSLGLQLIDTLSAQIDGEYTYESPEEGTLFTLTFGKADVKGIANAHFN